MVVSRASSDRLAFGMLSVIVVATTVGIVGSPPSLANVCSR